ncbi:MAG: deaminase [Clostridia bacterium]|nr:deaminase [Clostridia bacterium]
MSNKPINTLFMLMSLDGKISSGDSDNLDTDKDWCKIDGVKEGLHQYYEIEQTTDWYSLNTGRVMAKIGVNNRKEKPKKVDVRFVIIDRKPHLNKNGIEYLCNWTEKTFIVTDNKNHPAYNLLDKLDNLEIIYYENIDLVELMEDLKNKYDVEKLTIQSGGTLNGEFLRNNLIDYVNIVVAPLLVGGSKTSTLIDGEAITKSEELSKLKALKLIECNVLKNSYIQLKYEVMK